MTANGKSLPLAKSSSPLILFGIDNRGKPKAARFGKQHANLALKAATQLQLAVLAGNDPNVAELAAQLPVGRVHATGRTFVPFVRRDLYDKLVAAAANRRDLYDKLVAAAANESGHSTTPPNGASGGSGSSGGASPPHQPRTWQDIGVGHLVVAQDTPAEGWYEAIIAAADGDMLTLSWRDYPRERPVVRHRNRLALLHPNAKPTVDTPKATAAKHPGKAAAAKTVSDARTQPTDWREIDIGHLVLAKDAGRWRSWWEAIPIEKTGDEFKLRWRDETDLPPFPRSRFDLALICPDAA